MEKTGPLDRTAVYKSLSQQYGWTPGEIADLTPAQMNLYLAKETKGKTRATFGSLAEVRALNAAGRATHV